VQNAKLTKSTLFCYSLTELPVVMSMLPVLVFVPKFYTSEMGVPLALAANLILAVRIFDVLTDPLVGYLSDRTHSRFGRRRPWIAAATPVLMLAFYMLFLPPAGAGAGHLFGWMMLLSVGTTMIMIPYYAWAAELSPDYHERSRITGWRSMAGVVGNLSAQLLPIGALVLFGYGGTGAVLTTIGLSMMVLMPLCVALTLWNVPETAHRITSVTPVLAGVRLMLGNGPFKRLILAFMVGSTALSITTPLYLFFVTFVLQAEDRAIFMLTFFFLSSFLAVPFWVWLSRRTGKHIAYIACFVLIAAAHPFYLLLGPGDFWWMLPITVLTGFAAGGFNALPNSMKADVIDLDTLRSGENRAALFFSAWSFTAKMSGSLGGWIALTGLAWVGFDPSPGAANDPDRLFGLRFMFALLPSAFFLLACAIVWRYPITERVHAQMRADLARLDERRAV
jgi:GPH family glycoside/pentoside/hexuronide:cation symporter